MILIIVASRFEIGETARRLRSEMATGKVAIREIGVGPEKARKNTARWVSELSPNWVINAGFSAGLHPELRLGDVFVSAELGAWGRVAAMRMVDRILESQADKEAVFRESGAWLGDMESEAVREICVQRAITFGAVRVVSDEVGTPFPVKAELLFNTENGQPPIAPLLWHLLTHPTAIPGFVRFVKACKHAERELSLTTSAVVKALLASP